MHKKEYPLLTICLLTHNCQDHISNSLYSLLNQTYPNFEIVVSDNNSTDKTLEIIRNIIFSYPGKRIFLRHNIPKIIPGVAHDPCYDNSNNCLGSDLIHGEIIAICHDDIYAKNFAEKEVKFLIENPEAGAVFCGANILNGKRKKTGRKLGLPRKLKKKKIFSFIDIFQALLVYGNIFLPSLTFMAKKEVFEKIDFFDEERFSTSRDLSMWLRISEKYPIGILDDVLVDWQNSGVKSSSQYLCTEKADFFNVMDYYLYQKSFAKKLEKKYLRQYQYQKRFDDTLRAMNFIIKNNRDEAEKLLNIPFPYSRFLAFFQYFNKRKIQESALRFIIKSALKTRVDKLAGKILYKLRYE